VVTNAHVIAGGEALTVRDASGAYDAVPVLVDPQTDLAVLSSPGVTAPPIPFVTTPADRSVAGATLGFPGGRPELVVKPASVGGRSIAVGRDIYGQGLVRREVLTLSAPDGGASVQQGDSGGPFVTGEGLVGGVVFAAAATEPGTGYALSAEAVAPAVTQAITTNAPIPTGPCRF
jgi:S1-C subfamily serine protease